MTVSSHSSVLDERRGLYMDRRVRIKKGRKTKENKSEGTLVTRQRARGANLSDDLTAE